MADRIGTPSVVQLLRDISRQIAHDWADRSTGRTWRRPGRRCPDWCAADHTCTARHGYPAGEHRSPPTVWIMPWGGLTATRVAPLTGQPHLELRLSVQLDGNDPQHALEQGCWLPIAVNEAVTATLAELSARHRAQALTNQAGHDRPQIRSTP